jgi:hypothetical protein
MTVLHHSGPLSITIRLSESDDGWRYGLDTRERNGCGISSPISASPDYLTRASAIDRAVAWIRREHRDLTPSASAWLDTLAGAQPDLFEERAA